MYPKSSTVSGFWTGYLVHVESVAQVNVSIEVDNGLITGSFDLPGTVPEERQSGKFTGTMYGHWINVRMSEGDRRGKVEFHVALLEGNGQPMLHGVVPMPDGSLATVTLFHTESPARQLSGLWPFRVKHPKADV